MSRALRGIALKHERIAAILAREIRSGQVGHGSRLPGEVELAKRFVVSRNTVRSALAVLSEQGLITTRTGKGSFVLFDGRPLDDHLGWTHALAEQGVQTQVRVLRLELTEDPELAARVDLDSPEVIVVERLRSIVGGEPISMERSCLPATGVLRDLPERGLDDGSITVTLGRAGLHLDHCEQRLRGRPLDDAEAALLDRPRGTWFLHSRRISWTADDRFAEQVDSLLDPQHFELSLSYSEPAP
ncbi:transcriptional regulator, GntR family [Kribbella flavida DSM 17836]|uniref:Transcriptional regulator, GntR family n=1 Tax=Kribbella flavida (strain DSM 17836 / JCM 10339 / NBRC 14399) TaxID=479435 RepID=D2PVL3_KRIFD|nr:GntR family transcriptional regulator [Kribbella flavida]ADB35253.1 transcriptional regulator, GntR family [Kribbella flavida DSM 17836]